MSDIPKTEIPEEHIPQAGESLTIKDLDMILEAVETRQHNFPDEPTDMTLALVIFNIGNRFARVTCVEGEWEGFKKDIPKLKGGGVPLCPNRHVMTEGPGLKIGWIADEPLDIDEKIKVLSAEISNLVVLKRQRDRELNN